MEELLLKLKKLDVRIRVEDGNLKLNIPEDVDETLFLDDIRARKQELIDYIQKRTGNTLQHKSIPKSTQETDLRLTPAQGRLFVLQMLAQDSIAYNIPFAFEINGKVEVKRLEDAMQKVVQRHESLRTSFILDEDYQPIQQIAAAVDFKLQFATCTEAELDELVSSFAQPFDLEQAPLLRAHLVQVTADRHILLIDVHHIVFDGTSFQVFLQDLAALYMEMPLAPLTIQYKDYADWYYTEAYQTYLLNQKKFWLEELNGYSNQAILPTDFLRANEISFEGEQVNFRINAARKQIIDQVKMNNKSSLFSVLLSLFGLLQSKLTGVDDLVIGTPVAGRRHDDLQGVIGMFVNTLGIRFEPKHDMGYLEFLSAVSQRTLKCFDNQEYPYEELLEDLGLSKSNEVNPLFNTMITLNNIQRSESQVKDFTIKPYEIKKSTAKFDLMVHFMELEDELACTFEYSTNLFKRETINLFFEYLTNIIDQIGENPDRLLESISLLDKQTHTELLELNDFTDVTYPKEITLVSQFESQVAKTPDHVALQFQGDAMMYKELNEKANQVARLLKREGVQRGDIIGLLTGKTFETIIGMLGILKAGGAYLPIDVTYPEKRISYTLESSEAKLLLSLKAYKDIVQHDAVSLVYIEDAQTITDLSNPDQVNRPEDLCYVLYTSGTTGNPKGVMIEHRNLASLFFNDKFEFEFGEGDVWTMFHSHCFDFSVWEMYGALLHGGQVIIISPDQARDPKKYLNILQEHQVTVLNQTPTAFYNLIVEAAKEDIKLPNLRYVVFGGEALSPARLQDWHSKHAHVQLVNMYGITEITVHATYKEIGTYEIENGLSNIGRSLYSGAIYLLDDHLQPVPKGVIGEIYVGGPGVARGYLNNEGLTQERFINHPYKAGERLYKSGDLAVLLGNGELEYRGRSDHQVQLRGFRIELGEIENQLLKHELIENVLIIDKKDQEDEPYLCAYFVAKQALAIEELRSFLAESLPLYMIPAYFMQIEEMPYNSNNKVDKTKLPEPTALGSSQYAAPETQAQEFMVRVWTDVLKLKEGKIGIKDNFFVLGGDSLKAIRLIAEINEKLGSSLTIADIYVHQTIAALSIFIDENSNSQQKVYVAQAEETLRDFEEDYKAKGLFKESYEAVYPMNGVEIGMVFHTLKERTDDQDINNVLYHEQSLYPLPLEQFDFNIFRQALDLMVEKHAVFRKIYDTENLAHIVLKTVESEVDYWDVSDLPEEEQARLIIERKKEEKFRGTELHLGLIWRITIIKTSGLYHYMLFNFHHSLFGGWSLQSFVTELNNLYFKLMEGEDYKLSMLRSTYRDQILGEITAALDEESIAYWREELDGYKRLELQPTGLKHEYKSYNTNLGADFRKELEGVAARYQTNFKHLCFAAYVYSMQMLSPVNDVTVGIVANNRPLTPDGDKLLGCFLNTIPFRAIIPKDITWGEYITYIENKLRNFKKHEKVPFYKILEITEEPSTEKNPVFDVSFNYIDFHILNDLELDQMATPADKGVADYDNTVNINTLLDIHVEAANNGFLLYLNYSTAVIDKTVASRILPYFEKVLNNFIHHQDTRIDQNEVLDQAQKSLITEFNNTAQPYDLDKTVLDLFKEQVLKTPDNIALTFKEDSISYRKLDEVSDKWAAHLMTKGARKDDIIGLTMNRSIDMITGILSIFKAGCSYLPLALDSPDSRNLHMLSEMSSLSNSMLVLNNFGDLSQELKANCTVLAIEELNAAQGLGAAAEKPQPSDLAYTIYTSGSTGLPKGVCNKHKGLTNRLIWMRDLLELTEDSVLIQKTPYTFDVSVWELLMFTITGSKLVIAKPEGHKDPHYLQELIEEKSVTLIHFVPSMLRMFLDVVTPEKCKSLKQIVCSGEALPSELVEKCKSLMPWVDVYNFYGPTEAGIDVTAINLAGIDTKTDGVSIGRPVANTQLYIVNDQHQNQPVGVEGELLIGGVQVASGYLNREELTASKFIPNPYGEGKLYKTGDLAKWNEDGTIMYLGRIDNQVKLNGVRIELEEIERHLSDVDKVSNSAVMLREIDGNKHLVAYYIASEKLDEDVLRNYLFNQLPISMIPSYYMELDKFPTTSSGKLDRKRLPLPTLLADSYVAPSNEVEEQLVEIWADVLGREVAEVSVTHNFFQLGGNSLKAISMINIIAKDFSIDISIKDVFTKQTIKAIADYITTVKQLANVEEKNIQDAKLII